jgi:A/G-specific adenine glycosylase
MKLENLPLSLNSKQKIKPSACDHSKTFISLVKELLFWYESSQRKLPWRKKSPDPYEIWISEVMSQQSTLKMMLPYYEKWMVFFPTLSSLSNAKEADVLRLWQGLGYYSRARNLLKAAQEIQKTGSFPSRSEDLLRVKGIGPYTAAAIASIAFDEAIVPVDGNVIRVLSRMFLIPNALNDRQDLKKVHEKALRLASHIPVGKRGALAQALMDLGAIICRPGALAQCEVCPLQNICETYKSDRVIQKGVQGASFTALGVASIPQKKSRPRLQKISRLLLLYRNNEGALLLRKRPPEMSLGGQWELPSVDLVACDDWIQDHLGVCFELRRGFRHTIMNSVYSVWLIEAGDLCKSDKGHLFYSKASSRALIEPITLTTMTQKAFFVLEKSL